ncbi:MAG: hypothetical protein JNN27_20240 [Planctomycetes bacterium]|nr:hypothetical protein [Planctomycetota bacterium]
METNPAVRVLFANDLFVENEVFSLGHALARGPIAIGGVTWLLSDVHPLEAHARALEVAVADLRCVSAERRLALLCALGAAPPTRIPRHLRLWKALEHRKVPLPEGRRSAEFCAGDESAQSWFGGIAFELSDVQRAAAAVDDGGVAALVVALPTAALAELDTLLSSGWSTDYGMHALPQALVDWVVAREGIVFLFVGRFDDREAGVTGFAAPALVDELRLRRAQ